MSCTSAASSRVRQVPPARPADHPDPHGGRSPVPGRRAGHPPGQVQPRRRQEAGPGRAARPARTSAPGSASTPNTRTWYRTAGAPSSASTTGSRQTTGPKQRAQRATRRRRRDAGMAARSTGDRSIAATPARRHRSRRMDRRLSCPARARTRSSSSSCPWARSRPCWKRSPAAQAEGRPAPVRRRRADRRPRPRRASPSATRAAPTRGDRGVDGGRHRGQHAELPPLRPGAGSGEWDFAVSESVAGKRVLIVGYGSIGAAVERRLAGWEVTIERIARHAQGRRAAHHGTARGARAGRRRRHTRPGHRRDQAPRRREVPAQHEGRRAAGERGPRPDRGHRRAAEGADRASASRPRSTSRTPSRCRRATRCGRRPGLLLTPHVGGAITGARDRAYAVVRDQLARYAAGEPLRNVIGPRGY